MTTTPQNEGPVEGATSPSRGSTIQENEMNAHPRSITSASPASFPIAFPNSDPGDDLGAALSLLSVVAKALGEGQRISADHAEGLLAVLTAATDRIEPIVDYLDKVQVDNRAEAYLAARRAWVLEKSGKEELL